jgi:RNA polymerase sigma-70 factor (ECF subfamily)
VTGERRVQETDPVLIRAAIAGDVRAFEQIVRLHQQSVWRYLRRLLGDPAAAEDVAQETFLRVYRRLPTFAFRSRFSTWVFQIARNAGLDELRSRARDERTRRAVRPVPSTADGPAAARAEIDAALATLPVDQREALLLVEVLGLRYAEAAAVLAVPVGTVKSRVFGARVRLAAWAGAGRERDERGEAGDEV